MIQISKNNYTNIHNTS